MCVSVIRLVRFSISFFGRPITPFSARSCRLCVKPCFRSCGRRRRRPTDRRKRNATPPTPPPCANTFNYNFTRVPLSPRTLPEMTSLTLFFFFCFLGTVYSFTRKCTVISTNYTVRRVVHLFTYVYISD